MRPKIQLRGYQWPTSSQKLEPMTVWHFVRDSLSVQPHKQYSSCRPIQNGIEIIEKAASDQLTRNLLNCHFFLVHLFTCLVYDCYYYQLQLLLLNPRTLVNKSMCEAVKIKTKTLFSETFHDWKKTSFNQVKPESWTHGTEIPYPHPSIQWWS
mgnify:CR=1 FL=1